MRNSDTEASDEFVRQLRNFAPARVEIDPREVFFRAGVEAGLAQAKTGRVEPARKTASSRWLAIACTAAGLLVSVPGSFVLGRHSVSSGSTSRVAQAATIDSMTPPMPHYLVSENDLHSEQRSNAVASTTGPSGRPIQMIDTRRRSDSAFIERWISPLVGVAVSNALYRKSEPMLKVSHASVVLLDSSRGYLRESPTSVASLSLQRRILDPLSPPETRKATMLVAGDLLSFASNQEAVQ